MTPNGEALYSVLIENGLKLLNACETCQGTFTRTRQTTTKFEKSVLDYVMVTPDLCEKLVSMEIDESKKFTPYRRLKNTKKFSDHNAIIFKMKFPKCYDDVKEPRQSV